MTITLKNININANIFQSVQRHLPEENQVRLVIAINTMTAYRTCNTIHTKGKFTITHNITILKLRTLQIIISPTLQFFIGMKHPASGLLDWYFFFWPIVPLWQLEFGFIVNTVEVAKSLERRPKKIR